VTRAIVAGAALIVGLIAALVFVAPVQDSAPAAAPISRPSADGTELASPAHAGFLYGRVTDVDGESYTGRLRWGGDQEAFWTDTFNGSKDENPWHVHAPQNPSPIEIFGLEFGADNRINFERPFMARFGDIVRIEAHLSSVHVTLKSGTLYKIDRFDSSDIDDNVRVWDRSRGVVDIDARRIRTIDLLPTAPLAEAPERLHGTVRTRHGDFTGFIQWDRHDCVGADELTGRSANGERTFRYDSIRSIARQSRSSALVTFLDGRETLLSDTRDVSDRIRGIYVDDERYGGVLISWDDFERVEFSRVGSGPAYGDFAPGRPLAGTVITRDGRRVTGRLVYDFDESETTDTLDAEFQGVSYNIPFGLIASIVLPLREEGGAQRARVLLHRGEEVQLEPTGDLRAANAGVLIFVGGREQPEHVPFAEVAEVHLEASGLPDSGPAKR
jgi:hypothetical protein